MKIVLIGNISNGIGLERDATLLRDFLLARDHSVAMQHFEQPPIDATFDLAITLETVSEQFCSLAPRTWLFANPEWTRPESLRLISRHCELVLAKTHDGAETLRAHFDNVRYVGFLTADRLDASVPRSPIALHLGGNSGYRNTNSVLAAWREYRYWTADPLLPLVVVSSSLETIRPPTTPGITFHKRIEDDADLIRLQNECLYHILPSAYEGWGHAIHESQSVGAILLTTFAGPMRELNAPFTVPSSRMRKANLATAHDVSPADIRSLIPQMIALPEYEIAKMRMNSRMEFLRSNATFTANFNALLNPAPIEILNDADQGNAISDIHLSTHHHRIHHGNGRPSTEVACVPIRIAFLGNFRAPFSTECDLAWTLRDLGHTVIEFQEDTASTDDILRSVIDRAIPLFLWVHTHGWSTPGGISVPTLLASLRDHSCTSVSFHLDRYWGLNRLDQREDRVGRHPFWQTDRVFTADGGHAGEFRTRQVEHRWLPPAIAQRHCWIGTPDPALAADVAFVGAESYHPEYPFRSDLLAFLRGTYGDRFRIFQGVRGESLNHLYASVRVVVGDSCFGGSDYYWSDRVPETLGRGGFLIHPATRGLAVPGLVTFSPGDLLELADHIDYALAYPDWRSSCIYAASQWVRDHDTYHYRIISILKEVGLWRSTSTGGSPLECPTPAAISST